MNMELIALLTLAASQAGVPPALLLSVCYTESNFRNVVSPHDGKSASYGICQVKAATARMVKVNLTDTAYLMEEKVNAKVAAKYLKYQLSRYDGNWDCAVAAYNRGSVQCNADVIEKRYVKKVRKTLKEKSWIRQHRNLQ